MANVFRSEPWGVLGCWNRFDGKRAPDLELTESGVQRVPFWNTVSCNGTGWFRLRKASEVRGSWMAGSGVPFKMIRRWIQDGHRKPAG
jgi:hypothetical protein